MSGMTIEQALGWLDSLVIAAASLGLSTDKVEEMRATLRAEIERLNKDSERLEFWFSPDAKAIDPNEYLRGVQEKWSVDRWRFYLDAAKGASHEP